MKHTPGPWRNNTNGTITCGADDFDHTIQSPGTSADEIEANAKLIAAAPDLLDCLIELVRGEPDKRDYKYAEEAIRKAISYDNANKPRT